MGLIFTLPIFLTQTWNKHATSDTIYVELFNVMKQKYIYNVQLHKHGGTEAHQKGGISVGYHKYVHRTPCI